MVSPQTFPTASGVVPVPLDRFAVVPAAGWPLALLGQFLLVFALVALSSPGRIDIIDGQTRYEVARSLVDHGDSVVRDPACWFPVYKGRDGERYTTYRLPQSLLGVGAILASDVTGPRSETRRQFFFTLISPMMAALLAVVYALWFRGMGHGPGASLAWGISGVLCTPSWYYGTSTFDDILGTTAIMLAVAAAWLCRDRRPLVGATIAGLAMAWAVNCKQPLVVFILPVFAAGYRPRVTLSRQWIPAAIVVLGVVLGAVVYKTYDAYKFPGGGADPEFLTGTPPQWTANPLPGLAGLALSPGCGIIWFCPPIFLGWRGWRQWRQNQRPFCLAVLAASLVFTVFLCFLAFFKGEPCWGPRYMTPVLALWWVFVPMGCRITRVGLARTVLGLGVAVQLLGLSVDPIRLFVQLPLHWGYYNVYPWLGFDATISHLAQRPRELIEVLTPRTEPLAEFSPAPLPTHAGGIYTGQPWAASLIGLMAAPGAPGPLLGAAGMHPISIVQAPVLTQAAMTRYHVFNSPRPWVFSQWYLSEQDRPVELGTTIALLAAACGLGLGLMWLGARGHAFQQLAGDGLQKALGRAC